MKLKLEKELPDAIKRLEILKKHSNILKYREKLRASGNYKNFEVRFAWEVCRIVCTPKEICNWYDKYNCNDDHITNLFKTACRKTGLL